MSCNIVIVTVLLLKTWKRFCVPTVISSSFGAIFAQTAGFNIDKNIDNLCLSSYHFMVMLSDMWMQLCHFCYCFVVKNMKLCIITIWCSLKKKHFNPLNPNISIHLPIHFLRYLWWEFVQQSRPFLLVDYCLFSHNLCLIEQNHYKEIKYWTFLGSKGLQCIELGDPQWHVDNSTLWIY